MLDKPTTKENPAHGWRLLRFLGFADDGDQPPESRAKPVPKEPDERKHQFATWYIFAAFLGVMLIQIVWLRYTQVETIPYSQFEQLVADNKISDVQVSPSASIAIASIISVTFSPAFLQRAPRPNPR